MVKKGEAKVEIEQEEVQSPVTPRRGRPPRESVGKEATPKSAGKAGSKKIDVKAEAEEDVLPSTPVTSRRLRPPRESVSIGKDDKSPKGKGKVIPKKSDVTGKDEEDVHSTTPGTPRRTGRKRTATSVSVMQTSSSSAPSRKSNRITEKAVKAEETDMKSPAKISKSVSIKSKSLKKSESITPTKTKTPSTSISPGKSPFKSPGKITNGEWRFNSLGVPKCPLPCRESQFEEIWTFLNENITHKNSRCMYVSGVPGTGKTVIVQSVVDTLNRYANERKEHLKFQYVYINGLSLGTPDKIWKRLYCGLKGEKVQSTKLTPQTALKKLELYFGTTGRLPIVLVIDELDQILDKKQAILYQLLEWSAHHSTLFSLIAIFNTMSLPESGLAMRNVSRIGLIRCIFPPYTHDQLQTIVQNSLTATKTEKIKGEAVMLLSKKVAAVSGDARRALEIAKRAVEIVEAGQLSGLKAVDAAFKEIFSSPKVDTIKHCTALEQLFLRTISQELQSTGSEETTLASIYSTLCTAAAFEDMSWSVDQVVNAAMRLCLMKLVIAENESTSIHKRLSLNVPVEDINFALGIRVHNED